MPHADVYEWSVRVRMDRNALDGAYGVAVFLLPPEEAKQDNASSILPSKPSEWEESPYLLGQVMAIPTSLTSTGANEQPEMTQGFVSLDDAVADNLGATDIATVVPYLKSALFWKASAPEKMGQDPVDEELDLDLIPTLEVTVLSRKLEDATGLPVEGDLPMEHPEATEGKKGGKNTQ